MTSSKPIPSRGLHTLAVRRHARNTWCNAAALVFLLLLSLASCVRTSLTSCCCSSLGRVSRIASAVDPYVEGHVSSGGQLHRTNECPQRPVVCEGGAVNGAFTPGITPPPPAITAPPAGASEPPPAIAPDEPLAAASDPPPAAAPATPAAPPVAAAAPPASAFDAAARPQAMAAPTGLYSPRRIRRAVMGIVAMRRAKMMLARLSSRRSLQPAEGTPKVALCLGPLEDYSR